MPRGDLPQLVASLARGSFGSARTVRSTLELANPAWLCVLAGLALSILGLYAIALASVPRPAGPADLGLLGFKQAIFLIIGLLAGVLTVLPHHRLLLVIAWPVYLLAIALLVFLLVPIVPDWLVRPRNGARAWINLGPVDLQPGEFTKLATALALASALRLGGGLADPRALLRPAAIIAAPFLLIAAQPDLGTASLFLPMLAAALLAAGARLRHLLLAAAAALLLAPAAYPLLRPHQQERLAAIAQQFAGTRQGEHDENFQSFAAQTLVGAGGLTGVPDAKARALVRFSRIPEAHNDMVYAVVVVRFGLLGALAVIALLALYVLGAMLTALTCRSPAARVLVVALTAVIAAQAFVNIAMNVGLFPIVGVTLPFISYGGSSALTCWLATALILNVGLRRRAGPAFAPHPYPPPDA